MWGRSQNLRRMVPHLRSVLMRGLALCGPLHQSICPLQKLTMTGLCHMLLLLHQLVRLLVKRVTVTGLCFMLRRHQWMRLLERMPAGLCLLLLLIHQWKCLLVKRVTVTGLCLLCQLTCLLLKTVTEHCLLRQWMKVGFLVQSFLHLLTKGRFTMHAAQLSGAVRPNSARCRAYRERVVVRRR